LRGFFVLRAAEDTALLTQGKDDNKAEGEKDRKDGSLFKWFDYKYV